MDQFLSKYYSNTLTLNEKMFLCEMLWKIENCDEKNEYLPISSYLALGYFIHEHLKKICYK